MSNRYGVLIVSILVVLFVTPPFSPLLGTVEVALTARVTESTLAAGRVGHVVIELINVGSANLVDVKAHLQVPATLTGIAILQGSYQVFNSVPASSSVSMQAEVFPSATLLQGAYSLSLNLVYGKEGSQPTTDNLPIGIVVNAPVSGIRFDASLPDYNITSGTVKELHITITNMGTESAYDVETLLSSTSPFLLVLDGGARFFGQINPSGTGEITSTVAVSSSTPVGPIPLGLTVKCRDQHGASMSTTISLGVFVNALQLSSYSFDATLDDHHVVAGSEQQLRVVVRNLGRADAYDLDATVVSTNPLVAVVKNAAIHVNEVAAGSSFDLEPTIGSSSALPFGPVALGLSLKYYDASGLPSLTNLSIGLLVNSTTATPKPAVHVKQFSTYPTEIRPGDRFSFLVDIENKGAEVSSLQALIIIPPTTPFALSGPSLIHLGKLQEDQTSNASYSLAVVSDATARYYPLQLTLTYSDNNDRPGTLTETVSVAVQSVQAFELINISPFTLSAWRGEEVSFDADLLLVGTESARFVEVEVLASEEFEPSSLSQKYIGFMDPDSPVPFSSGFIAKSTASEGGHALSLRVTYWDPHNTERQQVIQIPVTVSPPQSNQDTERGLTILDWLKILFGIRP